MIIARSQPNRCTVGHASSLAKPLISLFGSGCLIPARDCSGFVIWQAPGRLLSSLSTGLRFPRSFAVDEQGRSEAAIDCLRKALRAAPAYIDAVFNLALLLQRRNKYAEAAEYWRQYLATDAQSEWAVRARRSLKFCEMQEYLSAS